jgi:hypothetical protein
MEASASASERINRSQDLLAKIAAQQAGGGGGGAGAGASFSTPSASAGGFGGYGQGAASAYGGGADGSSGYGASALGGAGGGYGTGAGGAGGGASGMYGQSSGFGGGTGALESSYGGLQQSSMSTGGGYGIGGGGGMGGGGMGLGALGGAGVGAASLGGGGGLGGGGMGPMGQMNHSGMQMGQGGGGGGGGGGGHSDPRMARIFELMEMLKPACRVQHLGEQLLGTETQKRYEVRKGAKHTYVFNDRVVSVNTHMGAWSMTIAKNETGPTPVDVKPRRTISGNNIELLRVHTVLVETDFDSFRLTDHKDELRAIEDLMLTYQCASTGFVDKLIMELEGCMQLEAGGRFGGIREGMKPRCAHLLRYAERIVEKLGNGVENLTFGPKKVKKAMKHKVVGVVTRYEDRWIQATATDITIFKVRAQRLTGP